MAVCILLRGSRLIPSPAPLSSTMNKGDSKEARCDCFEPQIASTYRVQTKGPRDGTISKALRAGFKPQIHVKAWYSGPTYSPSTGERQGQEDPSEGSVSKTKVDGS